MSRKTVIGFKEQNCNILNSDRKCPRLVDSLAILEFPYIKVSVSNDCNVVRGLKDNAFTEVFKKKIVNLFTGENYGHIEVRKKGKFTENEKKHINSVVNDLEKTITACVCYNRAMREIEIKKEMEQSLKEAEIKIEELNKEKDKINRDLELKIKKHSREFEGVINSLKEIAIRDSMTGFYNRHQSLTLGKEAFEGSLRKNEGFVAIMIDIDDFKVVNDTYGHLVGDEVIEILGKRLRGSIKEGDIIGRYGGEEFVLFLTVNKDVAANIGERIRKIIGNKPFVVTSGIEINITASLGIAIKNEEKSFNELLNKADKAMYEAKAKGKNIVVLVN